jgi:rhodanese-related sulfurtransferase
MFSKLFGRANGAASPDAIGFEDLQRSLAVGECALIDVREASEFSGGHVAGAKNMPLSRFKAEHLPNGKKVVLICLSGARSGNALRQAQAAGRTDVVHFAGGVSGWRAAGGALVR